MLVGLPIRAIHGSVTMSSGSAVWGGVSGLVVSSDQISATRADTVSVASGLSGVGQR